MAWSQAALGVVERRLFSLRVREAFRFGRARP